MKEVNLEIKIIGSKINSKRFNLNTDLRDFIKGIEREIYIPSRLKLVMVNHGYRGWQHKGFQTIRDLILSYRNGINWSEKSRNIINNLLVKYGFPEIAPKEYARS